MDGVTHDDAGVAALYAAWCRHVPFDNLRKLVALRTGDPRPLPGDEPDDFFRACLDHGTGGTCWSSSGALGALADHLGFRTALGAGSVFDLPEENHGTAVVEVGDVCWMLDSSMLTGTPHRLGGELSRTECHGYRSRLEPDGDSWMMHTDSSIGELPCRINPGARSTDEYRERHEKTRSWSVFNDTPYVLRHVGESVQCLRDLALTVWSPAGTASSTLDPEERRAWLVETAGFSAAVVADVLDA